jgi:NADH:ubiquinone oxidoreductase subunit K
MMLVLFLSFNWRLLSPFVAISIHPYLFVSCFLWSHGHFGIVDSTDCNFVSVLFCVQVLLSTCLKRIYFLK